MADIEVFSRLFQQRFHPRLSPTSLAASHEWSSLLIKEVEYKHQYVTLIDHERVTILRNYYVQFTKYIVPDDAEVSVSFSSSD